MGEPSHRGVDRLALVAALLASLHALSYWAAGPVDDDYIVHRYAANLLAGYGFVFNPGGEVAEGFTSPLWLFVSVGLQALGLPLEASVRVLGAVASAIAAYALARGGKAGAESRPSAAWPGFAFAASPAVAFHAMAGLGTVPMAAFLALFAASWRSADAAGRPPRAAGLWLACACLTRQEAVVFVVPFAVLALVDARRRGTTRGLAALLAPAAVALLGWTLVRAVVFGRLDPVTHAVKRLPLVDELGYGAWYLWLATVDALALVWLGAAAALALTRGAPRAVRGLGAGVALHGLFVLLVGGDWMALARFCVPALPVGLLLLAVAARRWCGPRVETVLGVVVVLGLQLGQLQRPQVIGDHAFFERRWLALGEHFGAHAPAGSRVALSPIGAFSLRSGLTVVDLLGLTHTQLLDVPPDLAGVRLKGHHRYGADWVLASPPEYVVLGNGVLQPDSGRLDVNPWERTLVLDPRFRELYVHVTAVVAGEPTEWFRRRDAAAFPGEHEVRRR